jgi:two-component system sensor histidine kinase MtrB
VEDARLHGGWLQAWGEPGGGSQFRMTLPRTAGDSLRGSPIPLEPDDSRRNRSLARSTALGGGGGAAPSVPAPRAGGSAGALDGGKAHSTDAGSRRSPLIPPMPSAAPVRPPTADPAALPGSGARVVGRKGAAGGDDARQEEPSAERERGTGAVEQSVQRKGV